jgi:hypothetical protein
MSWPMRVTCPGSALRDRRLKGVDLEIAGLGVPLAEYKRRSWPAWWIVEGLSTAIKIQQVIVSSPSTPLYGEIRWLDDEQCEMLIRGVERDHPPEDSKRVDEWLQVTLLRLPRAGRPRGTGQWENREHFEREIRRARDALRHQEGQPPTREELLQFFTSDPHLPRTSDRQLRRWCQKFGTKLDDLLREPPTPPPSDPA